MIAGQSSVRAGIFQQREPEGCPGAAAAAQHVNAGSAWILSPACHFGSRSPLTDLFTMSPATVGCSVRGSLPRSTARPATNWPSLNGTVGIRPNPPSSPPDWTREVRIGRGCNPRLIGRWSARWVVCSDPLGGNTSSRYQLAPPRTPDGSRMSGCLRLVSPRRSFFTSDIAAALLRRHAVRLTQSSSTSSTTTANYELQEANRLPFSYITTQ